VNYTMRDYSMIYADVREILLADDLSFANLEFPIVNDRPFSTYPLFNVQLTYVRAAVRAGIEVFSLANNHTEDQTPQGVLKTLESILLLKEENGGKIYYSGIRGNVTQEIKPETIYRNGIKIGFLALTQFSNIGGEHPYVYVVDYNNQQQSDEFLARLSRITKNYELFILSYHGGIEYATEPAAKKVAFFKALVATGVDIVYGHHPHVLQPFTLVPENGRNKLIIYSLGNFISGQTWRINPDNPHSTWANTGDSLLLGVTVEISRGEADIKKINPIPISTYIKPDKEVVVQKLETLANQPLPGAWAGYYQLRLDMMRDFLKRMPEPTGAGN
jgi:hypothetical protein